MMISGPPKGVVVIGLLLYTFALVTCKMDMKGQVDNVNPQFVFVPGIAHGAWCFSQVIAVLHNAGYTATGVDLTSAGINKALADNVVTVDEYLQPLAHLFETGINKSTILVGHSLGGGPISVIAEKYPLKVSKAVFLAAIYPYNNKTFFNTMPPSVLNRLVSAGDLMPHGNPPTSVSANVANLTAYFYNRSPKVDVTLASTLLVPTPYRPGDEPLSLTAANFGAKRKFYIKTLEDRGILPSEQQEMIDASPWPLEKLYLLPKSDHAAFFSQPLALAHILIDIARKP